MNGINFDWSVCACVFQYHFMHYVECFGHVAMDQWMRNSAKEMRIFPIWKHNEMLNVNLYINLSVDVHIKCYMVLVSLRLKRAKQEGEKEIGILTDYTLLICSSINSNVRKVNLFNLCCVTYLCWIYLILIAKYIARFIK